MDNLSKKIKSYFSKIRQKKVSYEKKNIVPSKDWNMILLFSQLFIILFALFSVYFYFKVSSGSYFKVNEEKKVEETKLNIDLLKRVVEEINKRSEKFEEAKTTTSVPIDPSI